MATRSLESFEDHLNYKVRLCCTKWIVLKRLATLNREYLVVPQYCNSNYCETCRANNLRKLRQTIIRTIKRDRWRLCTLTYPDHSTDAETILCESYKQLKAFIRLLRKRIKKLKYIRVLELHESGFPHHHVILNQYVPRKLIELSWSSLGGGNISIIDPSKCNKCNKRPPCIHIKKKLSPSYKKAAHYLTEEIEKKIQDPHRLGYILWKNRIRTITTSRTLTLKTKSNEYEFTGIYHSLEEALECQIYCTTIEEDDRGHQVGIASFSGGYKIGKGYKDNRHPSRLVPIPEPEPTLDW